ncbi:MAG: Crp/Fnr family transcriptional regulator [Bacteroidia bacterium]|nr:Crp/Fnr family transcriptional regulator [Bacteroidia bacterium]
MEYCTDCVSKCSVFRLLNPEDLEMIMKNKIEVRYHAKEVVFKQGSPSTHVLILTSGLSKIYLEGYNSRDLILKIIQPFELIAGPGMYVDKKHHFSLATLTDSSACMIEMEAFKELVYKNRLFANEFIRDFSIRTIGIYNKFMSLSSKQMHGRIAESLLYLSKAVFQKPLFNMVLTRQELSELAGLSKEWTTRILIEFKNEGIININNKEIEIVDFQRLEKISIAG